MANDPIKKVEKIVKDMHDSTSKYTKPVLKKYPLLFSFLLVFSIASILYGFEMFAGNIKIFNDHPTLLIAIGVMMLFFTGTLYKSLDKMK